MKQEVNSSQFVDEFHKCGRGTQFTYDGLNALYEYLEDMYEGIGEEYTLDVIALCCEYTEYKDFAELKANYDHIETMEDLEDETQVIHINDDSFIILDF